MFAGCSCGLIRIVHWGQRIGRDRDLTNDVLGGFFLVFVREIDSGVG